MIAGHVVGGFVRRDRARTAAAVNQSYSQPTTVVVREAAPAPKASKSVEQRLSELDDLATKGIITKDEYTARRKAILDSI
jgi:ribosomal protein S20